MKITDQNYVENVLRTESCDMEAIRGRLTEEILSILADSMQDVIKAAEVIDMCKKHIFYGRYYDELEEMRTRPPHPDVWHHMQDVEIVRMMHAAIGMVTEAGELVEMLYNHIYQSMSFDRVNAAEEIGDSMWYIGVAMDVLDVEFRGILQSNIDKLRARYPDKFTEQDANERDLEAEKEALAGTGVYNPNAVDKVQFRELSREAAVAPVPKESLEVQPMPEKPSPMKVEHGEYAKEEALRGYVSKLHEWLEPALEGFIGETIDEETLERLRRKLLDEMEEAQLFPPDILDRFAKKYPGMKTFVSTPHYGPSPFEQAFRNADAAQQAAESYQIGVDLSRKKDETVGQLVMGDKSVTLQKGDIIAARFDKNEWASSAAAIVQNPNAALVKKIVRLPDEFFVTVIFEVRDGAKLLAAVAGIGGAVIEYIPQGGGKEKKE